MTTWDGNNYYFSGQGVVLIGERDSLGNPKSLIPVGNVSALSITMETTVLEHKESQTGQRGIDLRLTTELKSGLSITIENFNRDNLALALRGSLSISGGGTVANEAPNTAWGKVLPLAYAQVSGVTVARPGPQSLTAFSTPGTPFDYYLNADAGSIKLNTGQGSDGVLTSGATTGGVVPTAVTVGATTQITVTHSAVVGDWVALSGFAGADAALINNKAFRIVAVTGTTDIYIELDSTGKTITIGTPLAAFDGEALDIDYTYGAQNIAYALTEGSAERFLRFEGLNTADDNKPVVVEVFKFLIDPLAEMALISDEIGQFVLEGNALADPLRTSGSKYFRVIMLR